MDLTTLSTAELTALQHDARAELARRAAEQQLQEDVRAAVERAGALGLDAPTVTSIADAAVTGALST